MTYQAIAIDGPAASGKSTLALNLAERYGLVMVNSGAMYRAITWKILQLGIDPSDSRAVVQAVDKMEIICGNQGPLSTITIDGEDPSAHLRTSTINENVSTISAIPEVRAKLVDLQRKYLERTHVVMEGRDIGSVVFPETPYKIYIDAEPSVRNDRRSDDGEIDSVAERDAADSSRKVAPLKVADGAYVLDTSNLSRQGVVDATIEVLRDRDFPFPSQTPGDLLEERPCGKPMRWIYWLGWMSFGAAYRTIFGLRIEHQERLIRTGPVLIASNHQSFLDPPLIGNLYKDEMVFFARKTLFKGPAKWVYPQWNAIPVDQDRPDMGSMKTVIRKLREGWRVLVFPEGARTLDGEIGEAASGVGLIAVKANVPIQPIRICGADQALPRGSGKIKMARISVKIGQPIILTPEEQKSYASKEGYQALTDRIMNAIKAL